MVVSRIKRLLNREIETQKESLATRIEIGDLLQQQKDLQGYGPFGDWVKEHFELTHRTANKYMLLFNNQDKIEGASSLAEAERLLNAQTNTRKRRKKGTSPPPETAFTLSAEEKTQFDDLVGELMNGLQIANPKEAVFEALRLALQSLEVAA